MQQPKATCFAETIRIINATINKSNNMIYRNNNKCNDRGKKKNNS